MRKAFTLVESLLYLGLFTLFIGVLSGILVSILETQLGSLEDSVVAQDGRYVLMRLAYDVRRSSAVVVPSAPGQSQTQLQLTIDGQANTYSLTSNRLQISNSVGADFLSSNQTMVSNLLVTRVGNGDKDSVNISFTVASGGKSENFSVTATPR